MGRLNPSRVTTLSGAYGVREISILPVQLTSSRIGNLTRSIHRGEPSRALSGGYAPDSAKAEGSSIVDEPGEG